MEVFPDVTAAFEHLVLMEDNLNESVISVLEQFVVLLYDRTSDLELVNESRKWLFTQKSRTLGNIPPPQAALRQHIKRASQANYWNKAINPNPEFPSPSHWDWWKDTTGWQQQWTALPETSKSCCEPIRCECSRVALQDANVSRLPLNALSCVPVWGNVQIIHSTNS